MPPRNEFSHAKSAFKSSYDYKIRSGENWSSRSPLQNATLNCFFSFGIRFGRCDESSSRKTGLHLFRSLTLQLKSHRSKNELLGLSLALSQKGPHYKLTFSLRKVNVNKVFYIFQSFLKIFLQQGFFIKRTQFNGARKASIKFES